MKKFSIIFLILFLISFTAIIKNSTKKIDENIFELEENIRVLKKEFGNIKLEHEYLSSTEKLLEFQNSYFEDQLIKKDIQEIRVISQNFGKSKIQNFQLINE